MQTFKQITDRLKEAIGIKKDKNLAIALGIKPSTYAVQKRREKIPYRQILIYCHDHRIDANRILLGVPYSSETSVAVFET